MPIEDYFSVDTEILQYLNIKTVNAIVDIEGTERNILARSILVIPIYWTADPSGRYKLVCC